MKNFSIIALLALFMIAGLSSCKYEEGPAISFIPKTERVANTWNIQTIYEDGTEISGDNGIKEITFFKEGNASMTINFLVDIALNGEWIFNDDKSAIITTMKDSSTLFTFNETLTILRLKEDELWVTFTEVDALGSETFIEIHLVPSV